MKYGKPNEQRKYKGSLADRKRWRANYYKYTKPKRETAKIAKEGSK